MIAAETTRIRISHLKNHLLEECSATRHLDHPAIVLVHHLMTIDIILLDPTIMGALLLPTIVDMTMDLPLMTIIVDATMVLLLDTTRATVAMIAMLTTTVVTTVDLRLVADLHLEVDTTIHEVILVLVMGQDLLGCVQTVHLRHLHVHKDDVGDLLSTVLHSFQPIAGMLGL